MEFKAIGVIPAIVTPKSPDGKVAFDLIGPIVDFLFSKGVNGLHVCGTTGEFATLTVDDRKKVLEECHRSNRWSWNNHCSRRCSCHSRCM